MSNLMDNMDYDWNAWCTLDVKEMLTDQLNK